MRQKGYTHKEETKAKIALSNTGKKFTEERRKNIAKSRQKKLPMTVLNNLHKFWSKQCVSGQWIAKILNISVRVYTRYFFEFCDIAQIKFLPTNLSLKEAEYIIEQCKANIPYKQIALNINRGEKQTRNIILKLGKIHNITPLPRPRYKPVGSHIEKLKNNMITYNKTHIKKGEQCWNWKGGITKLVEAIRKSDCYKKWRFNVFKRDDFKCIICNSTKNIECDHIYPFKLLLEDGKITSVEESVLYEPLWNVLNGRTLCKECHKKTETYGRRKKNNE